MSQSVSRLEAMMFYRKDCHSGKSIAQRRSRSKWRLRTHSQYPCSLTTNYEEQEQANKVSGGMSVGPHPRAHS
jgi:hypothetical protein